jgi:putative heme-binding domain-containing protein
MKRFLVIALTWTSTLSPVIGAAAPPEVHMLIPGFTVEEVPVQLPNLNNLRFAPDGSLTALGYNGKVWRLIDSDGDGLEDRAGIWWDKAPLTVPVGMCWSTRGLFVSSGGKVSLLRDTNGDGVADTEEIVASEWPGKDVASGNVDATGVTMDASGNLYFGLLTANYANGYRLKKVKNLSAEERDWLKANNRGIPAEPEEQVSLYDANGMRGSVQKWNADTRQLETIATGIRVPYHFAFNRTGDLFMTDQEGETWMPKGNPLDEFNHIVTGRHYGFPPRHERWLPELVSVEPVVAFGPQHESTCGFVFNEPHAAIGLPTGPFSSLETTVTTTLPASPPQRLFGPDWWEGEAIVAGQSRGKIWRVRLNKTPNGYVGKKFLIARLSMLTTDVAISPNGDLYVSCHSGLPDWGTGPNGTGKIFRIRYTNKAAPQWTDVVPVSPTEVRVTFDRAIDPSVSESNIGRRIEFGDSVRAAGRFEVLKPPYAVVARQEAEPRGQILSTGWHLTNDNRTLIISTEIHPRRTHYALSIAGIQAVGSPDHGHPIEIDYDLSSATFAGWSPERIEPPSLTDGNAGKPRGDYETGHALFLGEQLKCATCHRIRGEGAGHAPDLSNLVSRDAASVLRDIRLPSLTINPDYVGYTLRTRNGDEHSGFLRNQGNDQLKITSATGLETIISPIDVAEMQPAGVSLMPEGLLDGLSESQVNDLLTFLLNKPPKRDKSELQRIFETPNPRSAAASAKSNTALRVVLVASKQDHGPGQHDYPAWQKAWHELLSHAPGTRVQDAWLWPGEDQFATADVLVFYYWNHQWNEAKYAQLDAFQARGGGIVVLHSATIEDKAPLELAKRIGLAAQPQTVQYRHMPFDLRFVDREHDITVGLPEALPFVDEPYWPMIGDRTKIHVLANAIDVDGQDRPMMWTYHHGHGRVFASIAGHYTWTLEDPVFRLIVLRGVAWAAHRNASALLPALN